MATVSNDFSPSELDPVTLKALGAFGRRRGLLLVARTVGAAMLVFIALTLLLATIDFLVVMPDAVRWTASVMVYLATLLTAWRVGLVPLRSKDSLSLAQRLETAAPEFNDDVTSAVELADPNQANGSVHFRNLLQKRVAKRLSALQITRLLPFRLVARWVLSGGAVGVMFAALFFIPSAQFGRRFARAALPGFAIERASRTRVRIIEPSPPTRFVAERDAIGVIIELSGALADDAVLHWESEDGNVGETAMTPRANAADFAAGSQAVGEVSQRYAANLSVGSVPVRYRVTAGDAVTLWHELTPLPRPRVLGYEKLYRYPDYSKLANRTATEEHGDIKALQGTTVDLTVTFDQPVEEPVLRFGAKGPSLQLLPANDEGTQFVVAVSVKTPGEYQVDATSVRSGLNNPFSPSNTITPVLDTAPMVQWSQTIPKTQLVSSLEVLELAGTVTDDLPIENVVQEFMINGGDVQTRPFDDVAADRKLDLAWSWDLMHRDGGDPESQKLRDGDLIQTRLVAIDRMGTRSESRFVEMLIAGDGFDAGRHDYLESMAVRTRVLLDWASAARELCESLEERIKDPNRGTATELADDWKTLQADAVSLIESISQTLSETGNVSSANLTEIEGRALIDVESRISKTLRLAQWLEEHRDPKWKRQADEKRKRLSYEARAAGHQAGRLHEFTQARFSLAFSAAIYSDVVTLRDSVNRLSEVIPEQRLDRYVQLISGRLKEIDSLVEEHTDILSPTTAHNLTRDGWARWSGRWSIQMETLVEQGAPRGTVVPVLRSLRDQLVQKPQHVIDTRLHDTLVRHGRDLPREMFYFADITRKLNEAGLAIERAEREQEKGKTADDAVQGSLELRYAKRVWEEELQRIVLRAIGEEKLNRAKPRVDLQYAADQNLFARAIKNVTQNGYQGYGDASAAQVLTEIAGAALLLQGASDVTLARNNLAAIREGERQPDGSPIRKVFLPTWFGLKNAPLEAGTRAMKQARVEAERLHGLEQSLWNDDHRDANDRIDPRRWQLDPFVSAAKPLERLIETLDEGLKAVAPDRERARETLRKYVISLSEQARQAAEAAEEAEQETDERDDDSAESAEEARDKQEEATEKATETIQSLIDQANTADVIEDEQREVARDADAAAELIADAVREAKEQMKAAEEAESEDQRREALESSEQAFEELSDRLEKTAEHFEKIENGEDVSESRQQLREDEQQLNDQTLQDRYDQAERMAESAKQDPRELLRQLEEELQRNQPMQDALSDLSKELLEEAQRNLNEASDDEKELNRRLESADRAFAEKKRQKRMLLDEFAKRAQSIGERTLDAAADSAAQFGGAEETRRAIDEQRRQLQEAAANAQKAASDQNATVDQVEQAAKDLQDALQNASETMQAVAEDQKEKSGTAKPNQPRNAADRLKSMANRLLNDQVRDVDRQRSDLKRAQSQARSRERNESRNAVNAETQRKNLEKQLKKQPDNQSLESQIRDKQRQQQDAERAAQEAQQTENLAAERLSAANERVKEMKKPSIPKLDQPNPAAQLSENLSRQASERMEALAEELSELSQDAQMRDELKASPQSARALANEQERVSRDVGEAAADVSRAARHEQRLGQREMAEQLSDAAEQTESNAGQSTENAQQALNDAVENGEQAAQAGEALEQASQRIEEDAERLGELLGQNQGESPQESSQTQPSANPMQDFSQGQPQGQSQPPSDGQQPGQPAQPGGQQPSSESGQSPSGQQPGEQPGSQPSAAERARAEEMARTLDELDRALNQPPGMPQGESGQTPGEPQSGDAQQPGQPGEGQQAESQPGQGEPGQGQQQSGEPGQGQPSPIESSPTLAQMLENQLQQAARERMQSLQEAQSGQQSNSQSQSTPSPQSEPGSGEPPDGPTAVPSLQDMRDGDWGSLRSRGVDDAAQGRASRVPPGYAREVQAYFKAIAERASETEK